MTRLSAVLALGILTWGLGNDAFSMQQASLSRLAWLAGCWEMRDRELLVEEQWMVPRGKLMLGMGRTIVGGEVREFEFVQIREEATGLVYGAAPSGQEPAEFRMSELTDGLVSFTNPSHDFPTTVTYQRLAGRDSILATVSGNMNGRAMSLRFPYARVTCG